jgi:hypothetical protein
LSLNAAIIQQSKNNYMTAIQTLAQIPAMLYVSIILLPLSLYGFLVQSAPKKAVPAKIANPGDQLKEKKVDVRREALSSFFLGASIAFGASVVILVGGIIADYKDNRGLFAIPLPAAAYPPAPEYVYPPAPIIDAQGAVVTGK